MARGGRRAGKPGAKYPNRTDMQMGPRTAPVQAAPGQAYGVRGAQEASMSAVPVGSPGAAGVGVTPVPSPAPGSLGAFDRASDVPGEHVMTGASIGPGAGPESLPFTPQDQLNARLRGIYLQFPNDDIRRLVERMEAGPGA